MKKILFDIYHLPQFNFLKNVILQFEPEEVDIFCVNRGKLHAVIKHELPGYNITCLGDYKHNKGKFSMATRIIIPRLFNLFRLINRKKYKLILTAHYQANFIGKLKGIPNISFLDDPRKMVFPILKWSTKDLYIPPFGDEFPGVKIFNALKEWAYLSPTNFTPNTDVLSDYNLNPKEYIFIREVSTKTSNYLDQAEDSILSVADQFPKDMRVILSLENKSKAKDYPESWTILKEPVRDIHSLMYYSQLVISSGDSMAREGAILGVPSIYAGIRYMPANQIMIDKKMMFKVNPEELISAIHAILNGNVAVEDQNKFRETLSEEWDELVEFVMKKIGRIDNDTKMKKRVIA